MAEPQRGWDSLTNNTMLNKFIESEGSACQSSKSSLRSAHDEASELKVKPFRSLKWP